jgi:hypothetical protein
MGYGGCTPSKNDGMQLSSGGGAGQYGGGPPPMGGGPGGGPQQQSGRYSLNTLLRMQS